MSRTTPPSTAAHVGRTPHRRRSSATGTPRRLALQAGTLIMIIAGVLGLAPSAALAGVPSSSACRSLYRGDQSGTLQIATSPASSIALRPGQTVQVTATWATTDWARPELHKVVHCLLVDGEVVYKLSHQEKPTANDGLFAYAFTVPSDAQWVCDRARLSARPA